MTVFLCHMTVYDHTVIRQISCSGLADPVRYLSYFTDIIVMHHYALVSKLNSNCSLSNKLLLWLKYVIIFYCNSYCNSSINIFSLNTVSNKLPVRAIGFVQQLGESERIHIFALQIW